MLPYFCYVISFLIDHFEPELESRNGGPVIKNSGTLTLCVEQEKLFQNFLFPKHEED